MVHAATLLAGRYVLDEPIGAGGYCEVWRATDTVLTRQVAVKLLHAGYASQGEALARFKAEARHAGALSHENIARVYDYGEPADGQSYLVMELVDGPSLADVLARGPLGARPTMDTVAQVAAGLQAAHTAGLIHRDIKPANILFTSGGSVRITDFGIAHAVGSTPVTSTGMVMGTPGYIAPERVSGAQAGTASDLYALGDRGLRVPGRVSALRRRGAGRGHRAPGPSAAAAARVGAGRGGRVRDDADRQGPGLAAGQRRRGRRSGGPPARRPAVAGIQRSERSRAWRRRGRRLPSPTTSIPGRAAVGALAVAVLTFAALTCLVLISVTGFASGSHPAGSPSHTPSRAPSQAAPAVTASPSGTAAPSGTVSPSPARQSTRTSGPAAPARPRIPRPLRPASAITTRARATATATGTATGTASKPVPVDLGGTAGCAVMEAPCRPADASTLPPQVPVRAARAQGGTPRLSP